MEKFLERWNKFWSWSLDDGTKYSIGELLSSLYGDPNRHYHGKGHILFCLDQLDLANSQCENYHRMAAALFFHDAIYNTRSDENERRSADLFLHCFNDRYDHDTLRKIRSLILQTRHLPNPLPKDSDEMLIRDIDLSIMGFPWETYSKVEPKIRKEYHWVSEDEFKKHRFEILKKFLERDRIFLTDHFYEKYEKQARKNINRSLTGLKKINK